MKDVPFESSSFPVLGIDDETNKLKGVGTCTLARLNEEQLFLLNSAHTLEIWGNNRPIFIALPNGKTIKLPFAVKTKSITVDKLDIAVTPLLVDFLAPFRDSMISSLPLYDDFPIEDFRKCSRRVIFFGYPSSSSRFSIDLRKREIEAIPIAITTQEIKKLPQKAINSYNIDFSIHIIAKFERRNMKDQNGQSKVSPSPYGISGGAVYYAYVEVGEHEDILKAVEFAGIGNEYIRNISVIKATKKSAISVFVQEHFH
jgi:hypothetical protein